MAFNSSPLVEYSAPVSPPYKRGRMWMAIFLCFGFGLAFLFWFLGDAVLGFTIFAVMGVYFRHFSSQPETVVVQFYEEGLRIGSHFYQKSEIHHYSVIYSPYVQAVYVRLNKGRYLKPKIVLQMGEMPPVFFEKLFARLGIPSADEKETFFEAIIRVLQL